MVMLHILLSPAVVAAILIIWYHTDAFVEYTSHIPILKRWFKIDEYFMVNEEAVPSLTYPAYLAEFWPGFITKLLSCYFCFGVWCSMATSVYLVWFTQVPVSTLLIITAYAYVGGLIIYKQIEH